MELNVLLHRKTWSGMYPSRFSIHPEPEINVITVTDLDSICGDVVELEVDPDKGAGSWDNDNPAKLQFAPDAQSLSVSALLIQPMLMPGISYPIIFISPVQQVFVVGYDTVGIYFFEQPDDANAGLKKILSTSQFFQPKCQLSHCRDWYLDLMVTEVVFLKMRMIPKTHGNWA